MPSPAHRLTRHLSRRGTTRSGDTALEAVGKWQIEHKIVDETVNNGASKPL
jgi:hypothetical protein